MEENEKKEFEENVYPKEKKWGVKLIINIILFFVIWTLIFFTMYIYGSKTTVVCSAGKPIIYLYPEEETQVSVSLGKKDNITVSYPKYTTGWNVTAYPNGDLIDQTTGKKLYSLYYEADTYEDFRNMSEGFIVKGEDVAKFLDEKLEILGLNYKEKEEMIVYWLPKLEANKYNYIRFASIDEIEKIMPLNIDPKPDTLIRVMMIFKGLDKQVDVKEQTLNKVEREGFVAVEWGAVEIK